MAREAPKGKLNPPAVADLAKSPTDESFTEDVTFSLDGRSMRARLVKPLLPATPISFALLERSEGR